MTRRAASIAQRGAELAAGFDASPTYDWVTVNDLLRERLNLVGELHAERDADTRQLLEAQIKIIDAKIAEEKSK